MCFTAVCQMSTNQLATSNIKESNNIRVTELKQSTVSDFDLLKNYHKASQFLYINQQTRNAVSLISDQSGICINWYIWKCHSHSHSGTIFMRKKCYICLPFIYKHKTNHPAKTIKLNRLWLLLVLVRGNRIHTKEQERKLGLTY